MKIGTRSVSFRTRSRADHRKKVQLENKLRFFKMSSVDSFLNEVPFDNFESSEDSNRSLSPSEEDGK